MGSRQAAGSAKLRVLSAAGLGSLLSVLLLSLGGCDGFFVKPTSTTTTTPTPGTAADYAYVANSSAGTTFLSEYNVGSGSLLSVGTINLGYVPVALSVAPLNNFLYVASPPGTVTPGIFLYSIGAGGGLTAANVNANGGNLVATDTVGAMTISPDGNWLFTVNNNGLIMNEYKVNTTTGALTLSSGGTNLQGTGCVLGSATPASQTCSVVVSPSQAYVVVALGTAGDAVLGYSSASGLTGANGSSIASGYSATNPTGDFSVAVDANNFAYIARTNSLAAYSLGSSNANTDTFNFVSGTVPRGIMLNSTGSYLFTANEGTGTISSFGVGGSSVRGAGSLNAVTGSPFPGPTNVSALGVDNTGSYMVAVGYDASTGVRLYLISSAGVLAQVAAAASGTNTGFPALVAMTH